MKTIRRYCRYFSKTEWCLWLGSVLLITVSFCIFDREQYLTLAASVIGVTSLIFAAKGHPISQMLMIVFSLLYGWISFGFRYYGEMITYLRMTLPMAVVSLISWLKHPFQGNKQEVAVYHIRRKELWWMWLLTAVVTVVFYGILKACNTAHLVPGTMSVATSFAAVFLTAKRSPFFALAYAANDVVLIVLWVLASLEHTAYISVVVCFVTFLINDLYGFLRWRRMEKQQKTLSH